MSATRDILLLLIFTITAHAQGCIDPVWCRFLGEDSCSSRDFVRKGCKTKCGTCVKEILCQPLILSDNQEFASGDCKRELNLECRVQCAENFSFLGNRESRYFAVQCDLSEDGQTASWSQNSIPQCEEILCQRLILSDNQEFASGECQRTVNSECRVRCAENFRFAGGVSYHDAQCNLNDDESKASWSQNSIPDCEEILCQPLLLSDNQEFAGGECRRNVNSDCRVQCAENFRFVGKRDLSHYDVQCNLSEDGYTASWSQNFIPQCEADSCASNPCQNGGECVPQSHGFVCKCSAQYSGRTCELRTECEEQLWCARVKLMCQTNAFVKSRCTVTCGDCEVAPTTTKALSRNANTPTKTEISPDTTTTSTQAITTTRQIQTTTDIPPATTQSPSSTTNIEEHSTEVQTASSEIITTTATIDTPEIAITTNEMSTRITKTSTISTEIFTTERISEITTAETEPEKTDPKFTTDSVSKTSATTKPTTSVSETSTEKIPTTTKSTTKNIPTKTAILSASSKECQDQSWCHRVKSMCDSSSLVKSRCKTMCGECGGPPTTSTVAETTTEASTTVSEISVTQQRTTEATTSDVLKTQKSALEDCENHEDPSWCRVVQSRCETSGFVKRSCKSLCGQCKAYEPAVVKSPEPATSGNKLTKTTTEKSTTTTEQTETIGISTRAKTERSYPTVAIEDMPRDCQDADPDMAMSKNRTGGVFQIYVPGVGVVEAYCDTVTDGGGWIVFQRRMDGSVDFLRNWYSYAGGFGYPEGEFWLGLEAVHQLTKSEDCELRVDMIERGGLNYYAEYNSFKVGPQSDNYRLHVNGYLGNATDSMTNWRKPWYSLDQQEFSTRDGDHDQSDRNCASDWGGAWWYNRCMESNLNGRYDMESDLNEVIWWNHQRSRWMDMRFTEMKFRRKK